MPKNILFKFLVATSVVGLAGAEVSCQAARVPESGQENSRALLAPSSNLSALASLPLPVVQVAPVQRVDMATVGQLFSNPPASARPWVYWTWIDGNLTKEGISADLEAMKRVGIGGALILDVSQGMPSGQGRFFDARWQSMFKYTVDEAKRLGLQINMNNGAGYYGSGGSWVPPEKSMQWVYSSETHIAGGTPWAGQLPRPKPNKEYRDIAVLAVAENAKSKFEIPDFTMKSLQWREWVAYKGAQSAPLDATAPTDAVIPLQGVVDLTDRMAPDGSLGWNAPPGNWTLIRFGHASTGREVGPSRPGEAGLETDKLDKSATQLHFDAFVKRLNAIVGPNAKTTLVSTHIDSWEGGGQNWTGAMRDEFKKRRGYDPIPYLPILTGRVVGNLQMTERFLYDLRETVSELMQENYSAEFQRLAHASGLRNSFESYTTIGNDLDNANYSDEPMAEFWTPNGQGLDFQPTIKSMSSAAHLNGRSIVGAESFTSGGQEKWLWHPAMFKSIGDRALAGGVNRFVFHRYAAQPFRPEVKPGMQMGPWGLHYERTNTWWEYSGPWHRYLARCQYLLRQGKAAADVLKLESEEPLHRFQNISLVGYDYDACGPQTLMRAGVVGGKVVFASGASYRLLVLPDTPTMSVKLLGRIRDLVRAGAAIVGNPPQRTPGLTDYPEADVTLQKLVAEIWGRGAVAERTLGKGRVFRGIKPEEALSRLRVTPAFTADHTLNWVQRSVGDSNVFFVANPVDYPINARCLFRVAGKQPEMWWGESGQRELVPVYRSVGNSTEIPLWLNPSESVFIVFRKATPATHAISVSKDGQSIIPAPDQRQKLEIVSATYGVPGDLSRSRDARDRVEQLVAEGTLVFRFRPSPRTAIRPLAW